MPRDFRAPGRRAPGGQRYGRHHVRSDERQRQPDQPGDYEPASAEPDRRRQSLAFLAGAAQCPLEHEYGPPAALQNVQERGREVADQQAVHNRQSKIAQDAAGDAGQHIELAFGKK